jgi:hypothetical protein
MHISARKATYRELDRRGESSSVNYVIALEDRDPKLTKAHSLMTHERWVAR